MPKQTTKLILWIIIPFIAIALIKVTLSIASSNPPKVNQNSLPAITPLKDSDITAHQNKTVIVNFWASWCAPCRAEIPQLVSFQSEHKNKVQVIGVNVDKSLSQAYRFLANYPVNYPIYQESAFSRKTFGPISGIPTSFIITPDGQTRKIKGFVDADTLKTLLPSQ